MVVPTNRWHLYHWQWRITENRVRGWIGPVLQFYLYDNADAIKQVLQLEHAALLEWDKTVATHNKRKQS